MQFSSRWNVQETFLHVNTCIWTSQINQELVLIRSSFSFCVTYAVRPFFLPVDCSDRHPEVELKCGVIQNLSPSECFS